MDHLRQSICDVLTMRIGAHMRWSYGSSLVVLIYAPMNDETLLCIYQA